MATKQEIKDKIQSVLTLNIGVTNRLKHEEFLHTETDSILEAIYPTPINEISGGTHVITTPNSNFSYDVTFTKVGRFIRVSGTITCNQSFAGLYNVFSIDSGEYETYSTEISDLTDSTVIYNVNNGNVLLAVASANAIKTYGTITSGETYHINLTYNAKE